MRQDDRVIVGIRIMGIASCIVSKQCGFSIGNKAGGMVRKGDPFGTRIVFNPYYGAPRGRMAATLATDRYCIWMLLDPS